MRKKILGIFLCLVLCGSYLAGCALFEHNDTKDSQQVIVTIDPITEKDENGKEIYNSGTRKIYKSDLVSVVNNYAQQYMQNYSLSLQGATERLLDELVTRELLLIEAERLIATGDIEWDKRDDNRKMQQIYSSIDGLFDSLKSDLLSNFDESQSAEDEEEESKSPTYPVPDAETAEDDYTFYKFDEYGNIVYQKDENGNFIYKDVEQPDGTVEKEKVPAYIDWKPEPASYPCMYGTEEQKSLERETMRRLVARIESLADADFKATKADRAAFDADIKAIHKIIDTKGIEYVYPALGETHLLEYLVGKSVKDSLLLSKLQEYITQDVAVSEQEVVEAYVSSLKTQRETYDASPEAYQSAVSGGNTTVLYYLDDSYFFVKHILLPFSDAQVAAMNAYKADPRNAGVDYKIMRDEQMVPETIVYPHKDGENDTSRPMRVSQVFAEIKSAMAAKRNNPKEAERLFDEFTYKYNTDSGAFGAGKAYAVKKNDDTGHSGYMEEFYDGAMELYNNDAYSEGSVLDTYVVTDYGVHIMYLSKTPRPGSMLALDDPLTHGAYQTVRESFESTIRTSKQNSAFTNWQNERITYYQEKAGVVHKYTKRYKSLWKD